MMCPMSKCKSNYVMLIDHLGGMNECYGKRDALVCLFAGSRYIPPLSAHSSLISL